MVDLVKSFLRCAVVVLLLVFCSASFCVAEGIYAFSAIRYADKLGLSADQKAKLEAIRTDSHTQRMPDESLTPAQLRAKIREMQESEKTRVNGILTPAQQQKLRDLMYPRKEWNVNGYIFVENDLNHFNVRFDSHPSREYFTYVIHKKDIRLSMSDSNGKIVSGPHLTFAPDTPDTISPSTDERGHDAARLTLILDRKSMKQGMFCANLKTAVDATDTQTGERVAIPPVKAQSYARIYITPQPDSEPALQTGQRFIGTPWVEMSADADTPYMDVSNNKPIKWREIATKIATIHQVAPGDKATRLTFAIEGHQGEVYLETNKPVTDLPYLTPLVTEPTVSNLKKQYEGKQVWCYGSAGGQCVSTEPGMSIGLSGKANVPMRIRHLERAYMLRQELAIGSYPGCIGGERESAFITDNPLVVILDMPQKGLELSGFSYVGKPDSKDDSIDAVSDPRAHCLGLWNMVSDRWDFEREYSLQSPLDIGKKWPAKMRKAVLKGKTVKGMTRDMVAWTMGWPGIYGTKSEMLRLDDWSYDNIPFPGHIYFKGGRLSSEDWPRLP